jgi:polar amino acid transport system substrate-binding protein
VIEDGGRLTGFSVDLWHSIADRLGVPSRFVVTRGVTDLLEAVRSGRADVGIAAVSITADRERSFDFSQPMFDSGLQILVRSGGRTRSSVFGVLGSLLAQGLLSLLAWMLVVVVIVAHVVWLIERHKERGIVPHAYWPGMGKAVWWAAATLATQADEMPRTRWGRVVAVFWMFTSVVFVAYFTATVTASLTVQELQGSIRGPDDLRGKRVATASGSTSAAYLREHRIDMIGYAGIDEAYGALLAEQVDAVVYDSPILLYYASHGGSGKAHVVGPVFRKESYGIVVPPHSAHRKPINRVLLSLQEDGTYQELHDKWFGSK